MIMKGIEKLKYQEEENKNKVFLSGFAEGSFGLPSEYILKSFDALPVDEYIKQDFKYRKRRYSPANCNGGVMYWRIGGMYEFGQPKEFNNYLGGISRYYQSLSPLVSVFLEKIIKDKIFPFLPRANYKIGAHQIRIETKKGQIGFPAPEGLHRDGFDYICIVSVQRNNIKGGKTILKTSEDSNKNTFEGYLSPGSFLLLDDRHLMHYTHSIMQQDLTRVGYRDVFVISFLRH